MSARELDQIPIIVERLKERVDPAAVTAEISELWTSAAVMARVGFPWELIKHCFGGITAMRESSTIQAFLEEGRGKGLAEEARRIIMLQGPMRFGAADEEVKAKLDEIQDLEHLEDMIKRILSPRAGTSCSLRTDAVCEGEADGQPTPWYLGNLDGP